MSIIELLLKYSGVIGMIAAPFFGWIWWSLKKRFVTKEDFAAYTARLEIVEKTVSAMPSMNDFHKTLLTIEHMAGQLQEQKAIMERVEKTLDRQQEYLMRNK